MWPIFLLPVIFSLGITVLGCSDAGDSAASKTAKVEESRMNPTPSSDTPSKIQIQRSDELHYTHRSVTGSEQWPLLNGISVATEEVGERYQSRGASFVGFSAKVRVGESNCLIYWRATLGSSDVKAKSLGTIYGEVPARAGEELVLSSIIELAPQVAKQVSLVTVGYWTKCNLEPGTRTEFDFEIVTSKAVERRFNDLVLPFSEVEVADHGNANKKAERCYFDIVIEDINSQGHTLNRDFASFSLAAGKKAKALLRRTNYEGGKYEDLAGMVVGKRSYIRKLHCQQAGTVNQSNPGTTGALVATKLSLTRSKQETTVDKFARASFHHKFSVTNTLGKDCSFHIRLQVLDKNNLPLSRSPSLTQELHVPKGARIDYVADKARIFTWLQHIPDVGSLAVESVSPVAECKRYDPSRVHSVAKQTY